MQPTINSGIAERSSSSEDFVYVNTRKKGNHGDIVILKEESSSKPIIKRIIAKEGDLVSIFVGDDGYYHVSLQNSWESEPQILQEDYVKSYEIWTNSTFSSYFKNLTSFMLMRKIKFYFCIFAVF